MEQIDKANYEGYIWWSDQPAPKVFDGKEEVDITLCNTDNPFIIEGNLWDAEHHRSISIRYADGRYYVRKVDVTPQELEGIDDKTLDAAEGQVATVKKEYVPNKMPEWVSALRFLQYWKAENDPMCEGMPTLRPSQLVFIGFKKKEEK